MDKYHIYEEIGKGEFSQIFKGREKKKIEYVAIKRVDKSIMKKVVNEVQIIHKFDSPHILKFYDWYETRNNLWLIVEYCTGGDLASLLQQDHHLPEESIRIFGLDLLSGLKYLHQLGVLHCDLRPKNILIDEYGILKISDFKCARKIPKTWQNEESARHEEGQVLSYFSPELLRYPSLFSFASEVWALGCVLYQLRRGFLPFGDCSSLQMAEERTRTIEPVLNPVVFEQNARTKDSIPPFSAELADLLQWMLDKSPRERADWPSLCAHPFWGANALEPPALPQQPAFEDFLRATEEAGHDVGSVDQEEVIPNSEVEVDGKTEIVCREKSEKLPSPQTQPIGAPRTIPSTSLYPQEESVDPISLLAHPSDTMIRPIVDNKAIEVIDKPAVKPGALPYHQTSPAMTVEDVSRLTQAQLEGYLTQVYKHLTKTATSTSSSHLKSSATSQPSSAQLTDRYNILTHLLSLSSSVEVANIVLNTHFLPLLLKILRQQPSSSASKAALTSGGKGAGQLLAGSRVLSATCLALMLRYATLIQPPPSTSRTNKPAGKQKMSSTTSITTDASETLLGTLTQILKEAPLNGTSKPSALDIKLRRRVAAALGELLFYISSQEDNASEIEGTWNVSNSVLNSFARLLLDEEDEVILHYVAKTVENIFAQGAWEFRERLLYPELVAKLAWLSTRSTSLALQVTSASALSHCYIFLITSCTNAKEENGRLGSAAQSFISILSKVHDKCENAFPSFVAAMQDAEPRLQQAYINLLKAVLSTNRGLNAQVDALFRQTRRFLARSDQLLPVVLRMLEQGNTDAIKGKALLCAHLVRIVNLSAIDSDENLALSSKLGSDEHAVRETLCPGTASCSGNR